MVQNMNIWDAGVWDTLGIARTTDIALIKSAYAKKAKECHPEEFPQEFQNLQKAYKSAVQYAKLNKNKEKLQRDNIQRDNIQTEDIQRENIRWEAPPIENLQVEKKQTDKISKENKQTEKIQTEEIQTEKFKKEKYQNKNIEQDRRQEKHLEAKFHLKDKKALEEEISHGKIEKEKRQESEENTIGMDFNFDEVELMDLKEKFWFEFYNIGESPYLNNNLKCWQYFLKQEQYKPLYKQENFMQSFIDNVCFLSGWYFRTIRFFHHWLNQLEEKENLTERKNTNQRRKRNIWWKIKGICFWKGCLRLVGKCATMEQKQLHNTFISNLERMGRKEKNDRKLKSQESIRCYLEMYFAYCGKHKNLVHQYYQANNSRRAMISGMLIALVIFIWLSMSVDKSTKEKQMEERNNKAFEEKREYFRDYIEERESNIGRESKIENESNIENES